MLRLTKLLALIGFTFSVVHHIFLLLGIQAVQEKTFVLWSSVIMILVGILVFGTLIAQHSSQSSPPTSETPKLQRNILIALFVYVFLLGAYDNSHHDSLKADIVEGKYVLVRQIKHRPQVVVAEISKAQYLEKQRIEELFISSIFAVIFFGLSVFISSRQKQ